MRVLLLHNRYRGSVPSGENLAVEDDARLLRDAGVEVQVVSPSSDDIRLRSPHQAWRAVTAPIWSTKVKAAAARMIEEWKPDVVHLHNPFPLIGPTPVVAAHELGRPVVLTMHNYRLGCVRGDHFRQGRVCVDCLGHSFAAPALLHGCYRSSRAQTIPMVAGLAANRRTWLGVDHVVALTQFQRDYAIRLGFPAERVTVRPTWSRDWGYTEPTAGDVVFVGRLDVAKGIEGLVHAWLQAAPMGRRLIAIGDGPLRQMVTHAGRKNGSIRAMGAVNHREAVEMMRNCSVVVLPSLWWEGFPRVVAESFSLGRPVAASRIGAMESIIDDSRGWLVDSGRWYEFFVSRQLDEFGDRALAAREYYQEELTPEKALETLLGVYRRAIRSSLT